jgi:hypothetical protein
MCVSRDIVLWYLENAGLQAAHLALRLTLFSHLRETSGLHLAVLRIQVLVRNAVKKVIPPGIRFTDDPGGPWNRDVMIRVQNGCCGFPCLSMVS